MLGNEDCFAGIDVATAEAGIHYPARSRVFDKFGKLLGFYKPKQAQHGEKIAVRILQSMVTSYLDYAETEFEKCRVIEGKLFILDYDKFVLELEDKVELMENR